MRDGGPWEYSSDFDQNGVLFWLGTNGRTARYTNPCFSGKAVVTPSSVQCGTPQGFIEHAANLRSENITNCEAGSFVVVHLPMPMVVNRYTLRHGNSGSNDCLR